MRRPSSSSNSSSATQTRRRPCDISAAQTNSPPELISIILCHFRKDGSAFVRIVGGVLLHDPFQHLLLRLDVLPDSASESRVSDLVSAVSERREEASRQLVLALGAGLQEFEAPLDSEVDSLVVAKFEMQVAHLLCCAPVAAEERSVFEEEERACHGASGSVARED